MALLGCFCCRVVTEHLQDSQHPDPEPGPEAADPVTGQGQLRTCRGCGQVRIGLHGSQPPPPPCLQALNTLKGFGSVPRQLSQMGMDSGDDLNPGKERVAEGGQQLQRLHCSKSLFLQTLSLQPFGPSPRGWHCAPLPHKYTHTYTGCLHKGQLRYINVTLSHLGGVCLDQAGTQR